MIYFIGSNNKEELDEDIIKGESSEVKEWIQDKEIVNLDTETTGLNPIDNEILCVQIGDEKDQFVVDRNNIHDISSIFYGDTLFVLHNAKFDLKFLYSEGIKVNNIYDTFLSEKVINGGLKIKNSLKDLCYRYLNESMDKEIRNKIHIDGLTNEVIRYSAKDVEFIHKIREFQMEKVEKYDLHNVVNQENEVTKTFSYMEYNGVGINDELIKKVGEEVIEEKNKIEEELNDIVKNDDKLKRFKRLSQHNLFTNDIDLGINWSSNKQKLEIIKELGFNTDTVGDRFLSANRDEHELIGKLKEYSIQDKLASSFGNNLIKKINPKTRRIHPEYNQILRTGRISCKDPNLLQIPSGGEQGSKIRSAFIPKEGYKIVGGDYSSMELRIIAEFSGDPTWVRSFKNNEDLHSVLCSMTFDIPIDNVRDEFPMNKTKTYRDIQKNINFGLAYGMTEYKLADTMGVNTEKAEEVIDRFFQKVPKVREFLDKLSKKGLKRGYIKTAPPYGRIRWFPEWEKMKKEPHKYKGTIERASKNTPIQGTNADIIKEALINTQKYIEENNLDVNILLSIYDEIQTECREDIAEEWKEKLEEIMVDSAKTVIKNVPIEAGCSINEYWNK